MRLHSRIVEPDFWGDMEYVQAFSREERHFYIGLIQLADDSGCLLDSPLEFKAKLYPIDFDVMPSTLTEWRDHLVRAGKAVRYEAGGKRCLYLVNFHRHQNKRYWDAPEVPLPGWVCFTPTPTAPHRGTYDHGTPVVSGWSGCGLVSVADDTGTVRAWSEPAPGANADAYANAEAGGGEGEPSGDPSANAEGAPSVPASPAVAGSPPPAEDCLRDEAQTHAPQPPIVSDPLLLAVTRMRRLRGYRAADDDLQWLADCEGEFKSIDLFREIGKCAEHWTPADNAPNAKRANWRSRLRNWFAKAQDIANENRGAPARASPLPVGPSAVRLDSPEARREVGAPL